MSHRSIPSRTTGGGSARRRGAKARLLTLPALLACAILLMASAPGPAVAQDAGGAGPAAAGDEGGGGVSDGSISVAGTREGESQTVGATEAEAEAIAAAEAAQRPTTWSNALPRAWRYFGWHGAAIVALVVVALGWLIRFSLTRRGAHYVWAGVLGALLAVGLLLTTRTTGSVDLAYICCFLLVVGTAVLAARGAPIQWPIVAIALLTFSLGEWNSTRVSNLAIDNTAEEAKTRIARAEKAQREAREEGLRPSEGRLPVEMSEEDRALLEQAGEDDEEKSEYEKAAERGPAGGTPAWKQRGKQQRDPSRLEEGAGDEEQVFKEDAGGFEVRSLPPGDVVRANRWDVVVLGVTRWTPWIGLFIVLAAYLDRFTRGRGAAAPLPVSNRGFDALFPKALVARVDGDRDELAGLLRELVQKGESFIYIGESDPLPEDDRLKRLMLLRSRGVWSMRKATLEKDEAAERHAFVFESAWFRRLCFVVRADGPPERFLNRIVERLTMRKRTKAVARRTLNLVFDESAMPGVEKLRQLIPLARRANVKVFLRPGDHAAAIPDDLLEEIVVDGGAILLNGGRGREAGPTSGLPRLFEPTAIR